MRPRIYNSSRDHTQLVVGSPKKAMPFLFPSSSPPHILACLVLGARGPSFTSRRSQSGSLCAVLAPHRVHFAFHTLASLPPQPVGRHVTSSLSWRIFVATFLNTRQGGGCRSHTCYSMGIYLVRNLICSASTMAFATQSADLSSRSMSYVDLRRRPSIGVLMISSTWKN